MDRGGDTGERADLREVVTRLEPTQAITEPVGLLVGRVGVPDRVDHPQVADRHTNKGREPRAAHEEHVGFATRSRRRPQHDRDQRAAEERNLRRAEIVRRVP